MQKLRLTHHVGHTSTHSFYIYLAVLFLAFHYFFIVYVNSNFLATFISEKYIGYLYIFGSLANIVVLLNAHKLLRRFGNFKLASALILLEIIALLTLGMSKTFWIIAIAFIVQHAVNPAILYCLDIVLESHSKNNETGRNRGIFLTILNTPPIIATVIVGFILTNNDFSSVYILSSLFLLPLFFIVRSKMYKFEDPHYKKVAVKDVFKRFNHNRLVRDIFIDNILLQVFYAVMTIYLPLYLYRYIGFSLGEISFMFSLMLLPFVLLQIPIGRIVDKKFGEKRFLIAGFLIMCLSMAMVSFIHTPSILIWILVLFSTRIGAAIIEITTESYFFKHVDKTDADMIGVFRMSHAIAFSIMPLIGTIALNFLSFTTVFILLSLIILAVGLRYAFDLVDDNRS